MNDNRGSSGKGASPRPQVCPVWPTTIFLWLISSVCVPKAHYPRLFLVADTYLCFFAFVSLFVFFPPYPKYCFSCFCLFPLHSYCSFFNAHLNHCFFHKTLSNLQTNMNSSPFTFLVLSALTLFSVCLVF